MMRITINMINRYTEYLLNEEKSKVTIEKYVRDIRAFYTWIEGRELTKSLVLAYKETLMEK